MLRNVPWLWNNDASSLRLPHLGHWPSEAQRVQHLFSACLPYYWVERTVAPQSRSHCSDNWVQDEIWEGDYWSLLRMDPFSTSWPWKVYCSCLAQEGYNEFPIERSSNYGGPWHRYSSFQISDTRACIFRLKDGADIWLSIRVRRLLLQGWMGEPPGSWSRSHSHHCLLSCKP